MRSSTMTSEDYVFCLMDSHFLDLEIVHILQNLCLFVYIYIFKLMRVLFFMVHKLLVIWSFVLIAMDSEFLFVEVAYVFFQ